MLRPPRRPRRNTKKLCAAAKQRMTRTSAKRSPAASARWSAIRPLLPSIFRDSVGWQLIGIRQPAPASVCRQARAARCRFAHRQPLDLGARSNPDRDLPSDRSSIAGAVRAGEESIAARDRVEPAYGQFLRHQRRAKAEEFSRPRRGARRTEVRGVTVLYDEATEGTMDRIAAAVIAAYIAFPDPNASASRAIIRRGGSSTVPPLW